MRKLLLGLRQFQKSVHHRKQELFAGLANGQSPQTLFITCSDSRIDPNLITGSDPGEIFVVRNAGNLIPRQDMACGEAATVEYAVKALGVQDIVVCGHSQCGAMKAVLDPNSCKDLPSVNGWLRNVRDVVQRTLDRHGKQSDERMLELVIQENVRMQLENLQTLRCVADGMASGQVRLHGWAYDIGSGKVEMLEADSGRFSPSGGASYFTLDDVHADFA